MGTRRGVRGDTREARHFRVRLKFLNFLFLCPSLWSIHAIRPEEISAKMLRKKKHSLNEISHETAISLILRTVQSGVNVAEVAEKADSLYPVVSAASILAKVSRDRMLVQWKPHGLQPAENEKEPENAEEKAGRLDASSGGEKSDASPSSGKREGDEAQAEEAEEGPKKKKKKETKEKGEKEKNAKSAKGAVSSPTFGSGYPGDAETVAFLNKNCDPVFGFDGFVRFSWSTARLIFEKRGVPVEWYEEVEEEAAGASKAKQSRITNFFAAKREATAGGIDRAPFFVKSKLQLLSELTA
ncbi:Ribonuclease, related [Neospora caninum Liverpool]|uniref:Ribonuclease n=1 Tax=Neospora caninum (strain Liverpool) TaxID=572307 RepID=F0VFR5_NEOCL|nr:Ribonuclease, related [Neospora caninum Liverpool]CBZ52559.1 Ribonuclease, related [Neospora caninum Liverpool]|eukprot:XP_003882591.1 Ribonuclease, related [Neospora caninum Liverpool]